MEAGPAACYTSSKCRNCSGASRQTLPSASVRKSFRMRCPARSGSPLNSRSPTAATYSSLDRPGRAQQAQQAQLAQLAQRKRETGWGGSG